MPYPAPMNRVTSAGTIPSTISLFARPAVYPKHPLIAAILVAFFSSDPPCQDAASAIQAIHLATVKRGESVLEWVTRFLAVASNFEKVSWHSKQSFRQRIVKRRNNALRNMKSPRPLQGGKHC